MPLHSALFYNDCGFRKFGRKARIKRTCNHRFAEIKMKSAFLSESTARVGGRSPHDRETEEEDRTPVL